MDPEEIEKPIETPEDKTPETFTLTQAELDAKLQAESDKRVNQALENAKEKMKADLKAELESEKEEAKKLAGLTEAQKEKLAIEKERAEIAKERESLNKDKMLAETTTQLATGGLPVEFAKYLSADDAETTLSNLTEFGAVWQTAIAKAVSDKLANGYVPTAGSGTAPAITAEQFRKYNYSQKVALKQENPELYKQLTQN